MMQFIDLAAQQARIKPQIDEAIQRVLRHGKYIMGPEVTELEDALAAFVGVRHCISCSSGTDALLIAMMSLGIGPGDEVITVPYTWISSAETIALLGAKPVFVDIQADTYNMDPTKLKAAITHRTKAIMPVGIYGQTADMTAIGEIASHRAIPVIEDAAQSFGATHHGQRSCGLSLIGCTSFFPSKPLGCYGDGGAIFTDDDSLANAMKQIRVHGQKKKHHHPILGLNGRLDTLQAAILLVKLQVFEDEIEKRQAIADRYASQFQGMPAIEIPTISSHNTSVWAQYTVRSPQVDELVARLRASNIPFARYYAVPLNRQPVFHGLGYGSPSFPNSTSVAETGISLPISPYLTDSDQMSVVAAVRDASDVSTHTPSLSDTKNV